ncbi:kinase-like protein [Sistotremastrum niveocremeum HHB9708]|uniref:Kinase-like protein n=1 Tax=Sistotremastrum niveocremeum HHB9708 TaxID=1314777 RepID=A0A164NNY2_9AGAM|nr:kinase-like protein [Sistotremastrum niveocremeum HHB9708]
MLLQRTKTELKLWSSLHHKNILSFIGVCFFPLRNQETLFSLVSPWMNHGTIAEYVDKHPCVNRISLVGGSIHGYLHSKWIVHGDLKGGNVLITDDKRAVLCDFGLSRLEDLDTVFTNTPVQSTTTHNMRGTTRFMAPELFKDETPRPTQAGDMWAFGCFVLQIVCQTLPYARCKNDPQIIYRITNGELPHTAGKGIEKDLFYVCFDCWCPDALGRPSAAVVVSRLQAVNNPELFDASKKWFDVFTKYLDDLCVTVTIDPDGG